MANLDGHGLPKPRGLRSGKWPAVAKAHLANHPACEACGATKLLNVHHKLPFHEHPELELDWTNLITLCESPSHNCHLIFGHLLSWKSWNVDVVARREAVPPANRAWPTGPEASMASM
jgi:hypothetical protein